MLAYLVVLFARLLTGVRAQWIGCSPNGSQRIYFANHKSNLDALVIWASLPDVMRQTVRPVAARDYWSKGRVRRYLAEQVFRAVLIERIKPTPSHNPLADMLAALHEGYSLIIFPEGGRHDGAGMAPFKSGLFHLARSRSDIELVPVWIENMNRILPKGEFLPVPILGGVRFGSPLHLEPDEQKHSFLQRARQAVADLENAL